MVSRSDKILNERNESLSIAKDQLRVGTSGKLIYLNSGHNEASFLTKKPVIIQIVSIKDHWPNAYTKVESYVLARPLYKSNTLIGIPLQTYGKDWILHKITVGGHERSFYNETDE